MRNFFIISGSIIILFLIYLAFWFYSATDTKNIHLSGYIFDSETNKPIKNAVIKIENQRYENDNLTSNYSEYLGDDNFELRSNENGFYQIKIPKSAFIILEVKKDGYQLQSTSDYSSKCMKFKTYLEKTSN